jgi:hypothetical protein
MIGAAVSWIAGAIPASARKYVLAALAAVALAVAGLLYRAHVYDEGVTAGLAQAKATYDAALAQARQQDEAVSKQATDALRTQLKEETDAHKVRLDQLQAALATAGADNVRLSNELVRLHNDAAGGRPRAATAAAGPGKAAPAAEGAVSVQSGITLKDLMLNDETNYTICRKNAQRHQAVLDWYNALRNGDAAGQAKALSEVDGE